VTAGEARRRAFRLGHWAETLCVADLRLRGYRVLARRVRYPVGEIDIVARRGGTLAVIEVKARRDAREAAAAITPRQRRRIARAAEWLRAERPVLAQLQPRFDVMLVAPWRRPRHVRDARQMDPRMPGAADTLHERRGR
jgi:putative endonuclease